MASKNTFRPLAQDEPYPEPDIADIDVANRVDKDPAGPSIEPPAPKAGQHQGGPLPKSGVADYGGKIEDA